MMDNSIGLSQDRIAVQRDVLETVAGKIHLIYTPPGISVVGREISPIEKLASALQAEGARLDEGPQTEIEVPVGFFLARDKITADMFCCFLNAENKGNKAEYSTLGQLANIRYSDGLFVPRENQGDEAASGVTPAGAIEFCKWLSKATNRTVRLPKESEWMLAARGKIGTTIEYKLVGGKGSWPYSVHSNGFIGFISSVGEWVQDDEGDRLILKRCLRSLFERQFISNKSAIGGSGVYGLRILVEAKN